MIIIVRKPINKHKTFKMPQFFSNKHRIQERKKSVVLTLYYSYYIKPTVNVNTRLSRSISFCVILVPHRQIDII